VKFDGGRTGGFSRVLREKKAVFSAMGVFLLVVVKIGLVLGLGWGKFFFLKLVAGLF